MARLAVSSVPGLDDELGGLPTGSLVQLYGPAGAGKSTLALAMAAANRPAVLVLPEREHPSRMASILGPTGERVLVARPRDLDAQAKAVHRASRLLAAGRTRCVALDSLTFLYRFERLSSTEALRSLFRQLRQLHAAARDGHGLAVFTNQVLEGPAGPSPIGGHAVQHVSDVVLDLAVLDGAWRRVTLRKHPFEAAGAQWDVRIGEHGLDM